MPYCRAEQSSHATRGERWRFNQGVTLLQREKEKRQAGPGQRDDVYSYKWNNWNEFVATDWNECVATDKEKRGKRAGAA